MPTKHASVLVANDDRAIAGFLCSLLEDEGYQVICCYSGKVAYAAIEQQGVDLAILDMQMETRGSGLDVLRRMRTNPRLCGIPVIIYSADSRFLGEVKERLDVYECAVLEKPFEITTLLELVEHALVVQEREVAL